MYKLVQTRLTHPLPFSPRPALLPPLSNSLNELTTAEEFGLSGLRIWTSVVAQQPPPQVLHNITTPTTRQYPTKTNFGQRLATNSSSVENPTPTILHPSFRPPGVPLPLTDNPKDVILHHNPA
ncbi:hypothetical protein PGTUg99_002934 [Puccinia graminis f. sp. tritici]|uniref:Uncharacterized protein n=1 Tax=Puccinia graminis f. sp. tritici TaxID=56615 RepID=A0A5B0S492_PUCGR|nr:hypothetical protein PGTUg99_002934 [Puccinia graminis f. sp. tritici]